MGEPDWRQRIRAGREFDRETLASWHRVGEGSHVTTDHGLGGRRRSFGRPDIRFVIANAGQDPGADAVLEVKDRDWDRMRTDNARRAVRRDRRQILRYLDGIADLEREAGVSAEHVAAVSYRRAPSDEAFRGWTENYIGEMGIAVLWESGDAATSEWFARLVSIAELVLQKWADDTSATFGIWCGPQDSQPEVTIRPRRRPGVTNPASDQEDCGLLASAGTTIPALDGDGGVTIPIGRRALDDRVLMLAAVRSPDQDPHGQAADFRPVAHAAGEQLALALVAEGLVAR